MMTYKQFLLGKIAEECNEVAQRALKAQQFGLDEVQQGQVFDNTERLREELIDLVIVVSMLEKATSDSLMAPTPQEIDTKIKKVMKYLSLSQALGQVEII
jgi:NTP pyrophosphatase (non-canonical NTP hydrolase)